LSLSTLALRKIRSQDGKWLLFLSAYVATLEMSLIKLLTDGKLVFPREAVFLVAQALSVYLSALTLVLSVKKTGPEVPKESLWGEKIFNSLILMLLIISAVFWLSLNSFINMSPLETRAWLIIAGTSALYAGFIPWARKNDPALSFILAAGTFSALFSIAISVLLHFFASPGQSLAFGLNVQPLILLTAMAALMAVAALKALARALPIKARIPVKRKFPWNRLVLAFFFALLLPPCLYALISAISVFDYEPEPYRGQLRSIQTMNMELKVPKESALSQVRSFSIADPFLLAVYFSEHLPRAEEERSPGAYKEGSCRNIPPQRLAQAGLGPIAPVNQEGFGDIPSFHFFQSQEADSLKLGLLAQYQYGCLFFSFSEETGDYPEKSQPGPAEAEAAEDYLKRKAARYAFMGMQKAVFLSLALRFLADYKSSNQRYL
jgi:hypothetical protein